MKNDLGQLLARVSVNEIETQHDAVGRLVKILAEARDRDDGVADACTALFDLLASPRLAVVSKACHGLGHLLASESSVVDLTESVDWLVRAIEAATARQEDQRQRAGGGSGSGSAGGTLQSEVGGVTQALTRCLVSATRQQARREAKELAAGRLGGEEGEEGRGGGRGGGIMATLLAMERGLLYPALSHEATCFVGRGGTDPREVVRVVGPLAAAVLLQPEYANLRGGFLLKLSAASATASDDVKLCLVVLQAELLGFCAVHTAAHADVAAGWFGAVGSTALSLDSDVAWGRASRAVCGVAVFLVAEFRERGFPIAPLLDSLLQTVAADPLCVADEVAFLAVTALQSACVDERETLLEIVGLAVSAMPRRAAPHHPTATMTAATPPRVGGRADEIRARSWSLEVLVYPVVSMAAAGNAAAAAVLPPLEAALGSALSSDGADEAVRAAGAAGAASAVGGNGMDAREKPLRSCSAVALGIRRLSAREDHGKAPAAAVVVVACEGLQRRASELGRAKGGSGSGSARESAAAVADVECSFCVLAPLLLRPCNKRVLSAACAAIVAVVRAIPSLGVRLLPFVLYAIRRRGGVASENGGALLLLQILPELGAHKVAAKPVAGVVQALAKAPQAAVRGVGLRLAAALIRVNSRTFNQLKSLLLETPADHRPPSLPEPDESRLCRAAGMLDVCTSDPELGVECVRSLQALLADSSGAVTALALKAIAALCRSDCLDFDAALRIVTRKGKVAHTGRDGSGGGGGGCGGGRGGGGDAGGSKMGDPRVVESLAQLCGAGAEAATMAAEDEEEDEAGESDSDGSGAGGDTRWAMEKAVMILLEKSVRSHPDEAVRAAVYAALAAHLPALLQAEAGQHADEGAAKVAAAVREFLGQAMLSEPGVAAARPSLQNAAAIVLTAESADPSTWAPSKRPGARREGGGKATQERSGPSNRLLAALPTPGSVLQAFRDDPACPGLAGAALWSYPPAATVAVAAAAMADRDTMARDMRELMAAEGTRGGLALCPWQRAATPLGVQRYVARFFAACLAAESSDAARRGRAGRGADVATAAVESCRGAIRSLRGVSQGLVAVASASLASVVPASFSHVVVEEADRAVGRLSGGSAGGGGGGGAQTLLDGEEMFPLCAAMAARALPAAAASKVVDVLEAVERLLGGGGGGGGGSGGGGGVGARKPGEVSAASEPQAFWVRVAIGVTSEWSLRHPSAPEARSTLSRAARVLLEDAAAAVGSDQVLSIARAWFPDGVRDVASRTERMVVEWDGIDVGGVGGKGVGAELGLPSTPQGSICLALFLGLSSTLPGLRATGMHSELRQVFNIVRAFQEAGVCGAALCLATAASEGLSCGLVDSPAVLGCLRSVSLALDGSSPAALPGDRGELNGRPPAQDAYLGAAALVATCERRKVILPPGFAESVFESLRRTAAHRRGAKSGIRVASLLALASMVGCPLLGPGEFAPRRSRVSSATSRRTVEALSKDIQEAMEGTSLRPKNAAARVWGCLSAVGQDERSVGNPTLQASFGWAEGGEMLGTYSNGSGGVGGGGVAGTIAPGALYVAREGTLMNLVLTGLQSVASGVHAGGVEAQEEGPKQDEDQKREGKKQEKGENSNGEQEKGKQEKAKIGKGELEKAKMGKGEQAKDKREEAAAPSLPSLFAASAVACLTSCPAVRVPHLQMAAVVEALFRGGHGAAVETGCISLALALADKEQAYSTWLRGLFRWELFANLSREARRHLISVFDEIVAKVPSGTARGLVEEVWDSLALSFVCPVPEGSASRGREGVSLSSAEGIAQGAAFLSAIDRRLATAAAVPAAGAAGEAAEVGAGDEIKSVTTETFLPYFMDAFASLNDEGDGYLAPLDRDAPEAPLWDALVGLLSRLPRRGVEDAIAFKAGAAAAGGSSSENPSRPAVRAYLVSRVAAAERAAGQSQLEGGPFSNSSSSSYTPASSAGAATATTAGLGSVARWAARKRTDQGASAAILPRLVEGLKRVDAAPARGKWFQTLLDTAALPESCPTRAAALVSGASAAWEPSSLGLLVVGEEVEALSGRGLRGGNSGSGSRSAGNRGGAVWYSMSVTSPRAVAEVEKGSPGSSAEVLARLFKLSGLLSRRRQEAAGGTGTDDEGGGKGLEEVRWGVEGFIRGLRHSPPVLKGTLSRQFALFAESTAAEEALSCV